MAPQILPDVWERWAPAVSYFIHQQGFPIRSRAIFRNYIQRELRKGNVIRRDCIGRRFIIDLIETSSNNFDIIAFSVIRFSTQNYGLLGGEVVTELPANYPRAPDHVDLIRGMETVSIGELGTMLPVCCREDWMKASHDAGRHPRAIAEASRQKIVKVATERKTEALKIATMKPKKESPVPKTEDLGVDDEVNRNLLTLCKKAATILASKGEYKTSEVHESLSTQDAISFIGKAIDELQHWTPSGPLDEARCDNPAKDVTSSLVEAVNLPDGHSPRLAKNPQLTSQRPVRSKIRLKVGERSRRLSLLEGSFSPQNQISQGQKERQSDPKPSNSEQPSELHQSLPKPPSRDHDLDNQEVASVADRCQKCGDTISELRAELDASNKMSKSQSDKIAQLEQQLTEKPRIIEKNGDTTGKKSDQQNHVSQLERELQMTKEALKDKTDELVSITEQYAKALIEAGGNKEKCRCKDKEAYLESVEEHVEKLRGTMEDVLRHVSTYQGRKRRRTEGPDFEY